LDADVAVLEAYDAVLDAVVAVDAVAFNDASVNVDALMTIPELVWICPATSKRYVGFEVPMPTQLHELMIIAPCSCCAWRMRRFELPFAARMTQSLDCAQ